MDWIIGKNFGSDRKIGSDLEMQIWEYTIGIEPHKVSELLSKDDMEFRKQITSLGEFPLVTKPKLLENFKNRLEWMPHDSAYLATTVGVHTELWEKIEDLGAGAQRDLVVEKVSDEDRVEQGDCEPLSSVAALLALFDPNYPEIPGPQVETDVAATRATIFETVRPDGGVGISRFAQPLRKWWRMTVPYGDVSNLHAARTNSTALKTLFNELWTESVSNSPLTMKTSRE
jgi:hypothetical protein